MISPCVNRPILVELLARLDAAFGRPGRIYLIGETSQVFENMRSWARSVEFSAEVASGDEASLFSIARDLQEEFRVPILVESPAEVIPLPKGHRTRCPRVQDVGGFLEHLDLYHFDPYSVAFRFIARGDEPDYHMVLTFLEYGWLTIEEMDAMLAEMVPRFTAETIQQDPAELRRKYKGLLQMRRAVRPRTVHRPTTV